MIGYKIKRRLPFTLLELLISLGLAVALLSTLALFYQDVERMNTLTEKLQKESFLFRYIGSRLAHVLPKATADAKTFYFYTDTDSSGELFKEGTHSLVFMYDNGVDLNKAFSNQVLGRLYLDPNGRITLMTWPSPKRWKKGKVPPSKREILLEKVDDIQFEFFIPPSGENQQFIKINHIQLGRATMDPQPKLSWVTNTWHSEYEQLPALMRMTVTMKPDQSNKKETHTYAFPFPNSPRVIVYEQ